MNSLSGYSLWKINEFYNEMMFRLPAIKQAEEHNKNGGKVYMYYWTQESTIRFRKACHAVELSYVFGNLDETIYTGERADEELSKKVQDMWANFARTGNPSVDGIEWQEYTEKDRETLIISKDCHMDKDVLGNQRKLLAPLLYTFINPSYATLNFNVPFVWKALLKFLGVIFLLVAIIVVLIILL